MLTVEQAIERFKEVRKAYDTQRRVMEAYWTLAILYDQGKQWGYTTSEYGTLVTKRLRNIIDPQRDDVRVTFNKIHENVNRLCAAMRPHQLASRCKPATGGTRDITIAETCNRLLERWAQFSGALDVLREKELPRTVLGTAIIRRTLNQKASTKDGLRNYNIGWSLVYPWEIVRDPAATSARPDRDEDIIAHEKPRSVEWVKRTYGEDVETTSTVGQLYEFQSQIFNASGLGTQGQLEQSAAKGVMVSECYFQDADEPNDWPWMLTCYSDPKQDKEKFTPLFFGKSPFHGLPLHFFTYDQGICAPWGRGMPHLVMGAQDIINLSWTWLLRVMQAGAGKWAFEEGTIEQPSRMLNNRIDQPIIWKRNPTYPSVSTAPTRIAGPQIPPALTESLGMAPAWMQDALNLADVQRGVSSRRGESGSALQIKLDAAGMPIEDLRRSDELVLQDLLYATLVDVTSPGIMRMDTARAMAGRAVSDESLLELMRGNVSESVSAVQVLPATLRPKTPSESRETLVSLATAQIISPEQAQWEMEKHGTTVNSLLSANRHKQMTEIEMLRNGQEAPVSMPDHHGYHILAIDEFVGSTEWHLLSPEIQDAILQHYADHQQANMVKQAQAQGEQIQRASPSGEAVEAATQSQAGAMTPAISVS